MPIGFLVPAFLAGLAALGIPLLIHLSRRQSRDVHPFPSLMFIGKVPHPTTRRRRVRDWPLLLLRLAILAIVTFAFARPFLEGAVAAMLPGREVDREVVVLMDRSYSMAAPGVWESATAEARRRIEDLGATERATIVAFDEVAATLTQATPDRRALLQAVEDLQPTYRGTRYTPALRHVGRLLSGSDRSEKELVVISDFQRSGWDADASTEGIALPAGTEVTPVRVRSTAANRAVAGVEIAGSRAAGRERAVLTARITAPGAARAVPVTLEVGGREIETVAATPGPEGEAAVRFSPFTLPESGAARATVRIAPDAMAEDDAYHLVLAPGDRIDVLLVHGSAGPTPFVRRALAIGEQAGVRLRTARAGALTPGVLNGAAVVVLDGVPLPAGAAGREIREWIADGGGLVAIAGPAGAGELLPRLASVVEPDADLGGTRLGRIEYAHPVFAAFSGPRDGDFTAVRVDRYRRTDDPDGWSVLARYADGAPALLEHAEGTGRVLVWTSSFDTGWTNLPLQPVFLPFVHQLVRYASSFDPSPPASTVGESFDVADLREGGTYASVQPPAGAAEPLPESRLLTLERPGFYELRGASREVPARPIAANVSRAESDLREFDAAELVAAVTGGGAEAEARPRTAAEGLGPADREQRQSGWWYLLAAAGMLVAAESYLANRRRVRMIAGP